MIRALFTMALVVAIQAPPTPRYHASVDTLSAPVRADLKSSGAWRPVCPVPLSRLRLLSVTYWDFRGRAQTGRIVVNERAAHPLKRVFRRLFEVRFPIKHMRFEDAYTVSSSRPDDIDISGSFDCGKAKPSPCDPGGATGWSNHAYGLAVDLNPVENPYTCGGRAYHPESEPYMDRSRLRRGMVTPEVVRAFRSIGWGWGGDWTGPTKDYTHFSETGN